jgi:hypothetical protein
VGDLLQADVGKLFVAERREEDTLLGREVGSTSERALYLEQTTVLVPIPEFVKHPELIPFSVGRLPHLERLLVAESINQSRVHSPERPWRPCRRRTEVDRKRDTTPVAFEWDRLSWHAPLVIDGQPPDKMVKCSAKVVDSFTGKHGPVFVW